MKRIVFYQLTLLAALSVLLLLRHFWSLPNWYLEGLLFAQCTYFGGIGGVLYCLRGIYLNKCVLKRWEDEWAPWYYLRPVASCVSGLISCVFMKAGLLVLDASAKPSEITYGYLAVAFIAGYNVDNFMKKLEEIAQSVWGVGKSRSSDVEDSSKERHSSDG